MTEMIDSSARGQSSHGPENTAGDAYGRREIFFGNRYAMCQVLLMDGDLMIAEDGKGVQHICRPAYGTWMAWKPYDLLYELKGLKSDVLRLHKDKCDALEKLIAAGLWPETPAVTSRAAKEDGRG